MAYDAVLVARRGLGVEELRLATGPFGEAVRWALFAERLAPQLEAARELAGAETPKGLEGEDLTRFMAARSRARDRVAEIAAAIYPEDGADG